MAGFIRFSDTETWSVANWVYFGLMDHLIEAFATDESIAHQVEGFKWMQSLDFPMLFEDDSILAERILANLKVADSNGFYVVGRAPLRDAQT